MGNLGMINKMRVSIGVGGTPKTGIWAYVSGTEFCGCSGIRPVKIALNNAAVDTRNVIDLGKYQTKAY